MDADAAASMRCYHGLSAYSSSQPKPDSLTLEQAAEKLGICTTTASKLIDLGVIEGNQVIPCAPWEIFPAALETETVKRAVEQVHRGKLTPTRYPDGNQRVLFSTT